MDCPVRDQPQPGSAVCECHLLNLGIGDVVICVHGEIDYLTAPTLEACLDEQLASLPRPARLEVALVHATFVGARAITALLAAAHVAQRQAVDLHVTGCSPRLLQVLDIAGVGELLAASR
jgi:anti-anti-sigma factor